MIKKDSVSTLRLKYKSKFVTIKLAYTDDGLACVEVSAPVTPSELNSFKKITSTISNLIKIGVKKQTIVLGKLDRMVGIDHNVLSFMKTVVRNHLNLN